MKGRALRPHLLSTELTGVPHGTFPSALADCALFYGLDNLMQSKQKFLSLPKHSDSWMHIQMGTWNLGQIQIFLPVGSRWRGRFPARSSRRYAHTPPGFQAAALPSLPAPLQGLHLAQEWFVGHCEPVCFTRTEQKAWGGGLDGTH